MRRDPSGDRAHLLLGKTFLNLNRNQRAIDALEKAQALDPLNWEYANFLGVAYRRVGRTDEALAAFITGADLVHATRMRRELCKALSDTMDGIDVLATAVMPGPAPRMEAVSKFGGLEKLGFTLPFNVAGTPALSVCVDFDDSGLPLAMQIVGRPCDDAMVLRVGHAYKREGIILAGSARKCLKNTQKLKLRPGPPV